MKKRKLKVLSIIVVLVLALLFWGYQKIERFADTPLAIQQETIFKLPAGTGRVALEGLLVRDKLVRNGRWFQWLLKLEPELAEFKAGTYRFTPGMTVRQMLKLLASGKEAQFTARFIEGSRLRDWQQVLQQSKYLKHTLAGKSEAEIAAALGIPAGETPEGHLYPDTYQYTAGMSDIALLKRAHVRMNKALQAAWPAATPACRIKRRKSCLPWPRSSRKRPRCRKSAARWRRCSSTACASACACRPIRR